MAVLVTAEVSGQTQESYEGMLATLAASLRRAPGFVLHTAHPSADGWRVVEVWQSKADADRFFREHVAPHLPPGVRPKRSMQELHAVVQATGAPDRTVRIARQDLTAEVSRALIASLDAELRGAYSEPGANHFELDAAEVADGRGAFLVVELDGVPVGCGAVRLLDAETGELKRMYVAPDLRGRGLGRRLVAALEAEARALGVRRLVLETGIRQEAAIALYRNTGFRPIPLYGEYCLSPATSVCLGKDLVPID
jgi:putative acetyltransferase